MNARELALRAANRIRQQLDNKQYISYSDVGKVVNAFIEQNEHREQCDCALCQADRKYKESIDQAVKQAIDQGLGQMDETE